MSTSIREFEATFSPEAAEEVLRATRLEQVPQIDLTRPPPLPESYTEDMPTETGVRLVEGLVTATLTVGGRPLSFFYVEHDGRYYQADAGGRIGISSSSNSPQIKVWAQNDAARIINGEKFNIAYTQDVTISPGATVNVPNENNAFELARQLRFVLEGLQRTFRHWSGLSFGFSTNQRIEVSWPDKFHLASLSFVEATSGSTGYPLLHLKDDSGTYQLPPPELLWHEYAHTVHFASVPHNVRDAFKLRYLAYLATHLHDPFHNFTKKTDELVAWVEAWGDFVGGNGSRPMISDDPTFVPPSDGHLYEGAIANLLFVDMAKIWSLSFAGETYVASQATTFAEYARYFKATYGSLYPTFQKLAQKYHMPAP